MKYHCKLLYYLWLNETLSDIFGYKVLHCIGHFIRS